MAAANDFRHDDTLPRMSKLRTPIASLSLDACVCMYEKNTRGALPEDLKSTRGSHHFTLYLFNIIGLFPKVSVFSLKGKSQLIGSLPASLRISLASLLG